MVPWDFVHDVAMKGLDGVAAGWLDIFDAVYEQPVTGYQVWVSLRVLGAPLGSLGTRKRTIGPVGAWGIG